MRRKPGSRDVLPLSKSGTARGADPTGEAFRPEWIDFEHGIRVGNLEPHERITQILKHRLEKGHGTGFITDRWGRGVYWQWICWLSRANREAKPLSSAYNFGCAKLFIFIDRSQRVFQSGLQIERGQAVGPAQYPGTVLEDDWDWHRLMAQARKGTVLDRELRRLLVDEGFVVEIGDFDRSTRIDAGSWKGAAALRTAARRATPGRWASFQLYHPMPADEVAGCTGLELVQAVLGTFNEVLGVMNIAMQVPLTSSGPGRGPLRRE